MTDLKQQRQDTCDGLPTSLTVDEFLMRIGQVGRFQILVMIVFSLTFVLPAYQALAMVFIADSPPWRCLNETQCNTSRLYTTTERCNMSRSSWTYTRPKTYSIVTEYDLVCDRDFLSHLANSALFFGQIIGSVCFGWLSDKFGRKNSLFACLLAYIIATFVSSFSPNIWYLIAFRILSGVCHSGVLLSAVVLSVELVGPKYRALAGLIIWNSWTVSICFLSLQSWLISDWKKLMMVLSAPYIFVPICGLLWVPESIRWYRSQNKIIEAEAVLKRVAMFNRKEYPANSRLTAIHYKEQTHSSYKHLFFPANVLWTTLTLCIMWFTNDTLYYGIALLTSDFGGELHRDFVLLSIIEIPANLVTIYILDKIGRKKGTVMGYVVTISSLLTYGILRAYRVKIHSGIRITFGIVVKSCSVLSWCGTEIWSTELYPTDIRAKAMGLFFLMSQLGGAAAPWIAQWISKFEISSPFFVIGGLAFLSCSLSLTLNETFGTTISDTVEQNKNSDGISIEECGITTAL